MRRAAAVGALVLGLGLGVVSIPAAHADESTSAGPWNGSTLVPDPRPCDHDDICGRFQREGSALLGRRSISVSFSVEAVTTSPGCALPAKPASVASTPSPVTFSRALSFECNGTYRSVVSASANFAGGTHTLDRTFAVANPAPDVDPPVATAGAGRTVTVSWSALREPPHDLRGYLVLRTASGVTEEVASLPPTQTSWTDAAPPAQGGSLTYHVQTRRAGAHPADPADEVTSPGASSAPIAVAAAGSGTTVPGGPGGGPGGTGGTGSGGSGTGGRPGTSPSLSSPAFRAPRVGTPSRGSPAVRVPAVEDTYGEVLPYDEPEPGEPEPVLPNDDLASEPLEQVPGRGLVVPLAIGLVLAVWALHLRVLARMARPEYVDLADDGAEIVVY